MDDLLLVTPTKKSHMAKFPQRNVSYLEENCNIWEIPYLSKTNECV